MYQVVRVWEDEDSSTYRNIKTFDTKKEAEAFKQKCEDYFPRYLFWIKEV